MKKFVKSGRYLLWIAAFMMIGGASVAMGKLVGQHGEDDAATGAGLLVAGILIWIRASMKERRFEQQNSPLV